jgi:hypothetical protein
VIDYDMDDWIECKEQDLIIADPSGSLSTCITSLLDNKTNKLDDKVFDDITYKVLLDALLFAQDLEVDYNEYSF